MWEGGRNGVHALSSAEVLSPDLLQCTCVFRTHMEVFKSLVVLRL